MTVAAAVCVDGGLSCAACVGVCVCGGGRCVSVCVCGGVKRWLARISEAIAAAVCEQTVGNRVPHALAFVYLLLTPPKASTHRGCVCVSAPPPPPLPRRPRRYGWNLAISLVCGNVNIWKGASTTSLTTIATQRIVAEVLERNGLPGRGAALLCPPSTPFPLPTSPPPSPRLVHTC